MKTVDAPSSGGTSFFSVIQHHLKTDYAGRLLALMLRELGRQEPAAFAHFLHSALPRLDPVAEKAVARGLAQFDREWRYCDGRRADLAVLLHGKAIVLFEIKEEDVAAAHNIDQLSDYLDHIENTTSPPAFVHLSRYTPFHALAALKQAKDAHDIRYRHLYEAVTETVARGNSPVARMIRDYMEDIGVSTFKAVLEEDRTALTFLVTQMAGFNSFHGLGKLQSYAGALRGPELLKLLLANAQVIGDWFYEHNQDVFQSKTPGKQRRAQRPKARFLVKQRYQRSALAAAAKQNGDGGLVDLSSKAVQEGNLYVFTSASLPRHKPDEWAYVELGQTVNVSSAEKQPARFSLYAHLYWKGFSEGVLRESDWLDALPDEEGVMRHMRQLIKGALSGVKKQKSRPTIFDQLSAPGSS